MSELTDNDIAQSAFWKRLRAKPSIWLANTRNHNRTKGAVMAERIKWLGQYLAYLWRQCFGSRWRTFDRIDEVETDRWEFTMRRAFELQKEYDKRGVGHRYEVQYIPWGER